MDYPPRIPEAEKGPHQEVNEDGVVMKHPGYMFRTCSCGQLYRCAVNAPVTDCGDPKRHKQ